MAACRQQPGNHRDDGRYLTSRGDAPACSGLATSIDRASEFVSSGRTTTSTAPGPITAACRWQAAPEALRSAGIALDHGASPAIASAPSRPAMPGRPLLSHGSPRQRAQSVYLLFNVPGPRTSIVNPDVTAKFAIA